MAADLQSVFFNSDEFADDTIIYNDTVSDVTISGIMEYGPGSAAVDNKAATSARIMVRASEVPDPGYRHTFTVDGTVWQVAMNGSVPDVSGDGAVWHIGLTTNEKVMSWRT